MKPIFKILAKFNKAVLPKYAYRDLNKLSKFDYVIIGWRYWVTINSLD